MTIPHYFGTNDSTNNQTVGGRYLLSVLNSGLFFFTVLLSLCYVTLLTLSLAMNTNL